MLKPSPRRRLLRTPRTASCRRGPGRALGGGITSRGLVSTCSRQRSGPLPLKSRGWRERLPFIAGRHSYPRRLRPLSKNFPMVSEFGMDSLPPGSRNCFACNESKKPGLQNDSTPHLYRDFARCVIEFPASPKRRSPATRRGLVVQMTPYHHAPSGRPAPDVRLYFVNASAFWVCTRLLRPDYRRSDLQGQSYDIILQ